MSKGRLILTNNKGVKLSIRSPKVIIRDTTLVLPTFLNRNKANRNLNTSLVKRVLFFYIFLRAY